MKKFLIVTILFIVVLIISLLYWQFYNSNQQKNTMSTNNPNATSTNTIKGSKEDKAILVLYSSWEPVKPNDSGQHSFVLFPSGKVISTGNLNKEWQLEKTKLAEVIAIARSLLKKNCKEEPPYHDFYQTLSIDLDGKSKRIEFPSCREEIDKIGELLMANSRS